MSEMNERPQLQEMQENGRLIRWLNAIERVGNKLPQPFFLFLYFAIAVMIISYLAEGTSVSVERAVGGEMQRVTISVVNLLNPDYIRNILINWVSIYVNFPPLGIVMVMMLAIGYAQYTGFFDSFMKNTLINAPNFLVTFALCFVSAISSIASNAGIIFSPTIGAALFAALGRNPILGALAGYATAHGSFSATIVPSATDAMLAGITQAVTDTMGFHNSAQTSPLNNYYFLLVSVFTIAIAATIVTEFVSSKVVRQGVVNENVRTETTPAEKRGLFWAFIGFVLYVAIILALTVPENAFFRSPSGELVPSSPLIDGIVSVLFFFFIFIGTGYGLGAGTIKKSADVVTYMGKGISDSISFFAIAFPSALFIRFFSDSRLADIISSRGADLLMATNLTGIPLILLFIVFVGFSNLFMTSASAKWLILAPIFVPMFYQIGWMPAFTQLVYRVADSAANPIAPINIFLPIMLGIMNRYKRPEDPDFGLGTLISYGIPYSVAFFVVMTATLFVWMFFNIPLGPGVELFVR